MDLEEESDEIRRNDTGGAESAQRHWGGFQKTDSLTGDEIHLEVEYNPETGEWAGVECPGARQSSKESSDDQAESSEIRKKSHSDETQAGHVGPQISSERVQHHHDIQGHVGNAEQQFSKHVQSHNIEDLSATSSDKSAGRSEFNAQSTASEHLPKQNDPPKGNVAKTGDKAGDDPIVIDDDDDDDVVVVGEVGKRVIPQTRIQSAFAVPRMQRFTQRDTCISVVEDSDEDISIMTDVSDSDDDTHARPSFSTDLARISNGCQRQREPAVVSDKSDGQDTRRGFPNRPVSAEAREKVQNDQSLSSQLGAKAPMMPEKRNTGAERIESSKDTSADVTVIDNNEPGMAAQEGRKGGAEKSTVTALKTRRVTTEKDQNDSMILTCESGDDDDDDDGNKGHSSKNSERDVPDQGEGDVAGGLVSQSQKRKSQDASFSSFPSKMRREDAPNVPAVAAKRSSSTRSVSSSQLTVPDNKTCEHGTGKVIEVVDLEAGPFSSDDRAEVESSSGAEVLSSATDCAAIIQQQLRKAPQPVLLVKPTDQGLLYRSAAPGLQESGLGWTDGKPQQSTGQSVQKSQPEAPPLSLQKICEENLTSSGTDSGQDLLFQIGMNASRRDKVNDQRQESSRPSKTANIRVVLSEADACPPCFVVLTRSSPQLQLTDVKNQLEKQGYLKQSKANSFTSAVPSTAGITNILSGTQSSLHAPSVGQSSQPCDPAMVTDEPCEKLRSSEKANAGTGTVAKKQQPVNVQSVIQLGQAPDPVVVTDEPCEKLHSVEDVDAETSPVSKQQAACPYPDPAENCYFPLSVEALHQTDFLSHLRRSSLSEAMLSFLQASERKMLSRCSCFATRSQCDCPIAVIQWGTHSLSAVRRDILMVMWTDVIRECIVDYTMTSHTFLNMYSHPCVWGKLTSEELVALVKYKRISKNHTNKSLISLVFLMYACEEYLYTSATITPALRSKLSRNVESPVIVTIPRAHKKTCAVVIRPRAVRGSSKASSLSYPTNFLPQTRNGETACETCSSNVLPTCERVRGTGRRGRPLQTSKTSYRTGSSRLPETRKTACETQTRGARLQSGEMSCETESSSFIGSSLKKISEGSETESHRLIYPGCSCTKLSEADEKERESWQTIKVNGKKVVLENLGLLRFMGKNVFTFGMRGKLFLSLAELTCRGLLPSDTKGKLLVKECLSLLPSTDIRLPNLVEKAFISEFFDVKLDLCHLVSPFALNRIYRRLSHQDISYRVHVLTLFYEMRLGHHCYWTLQVTPPTTQLHQIAGYEHPEGKCEPAAMIISTEEEQDRDATEYFDGGGGTPPINKGLPDCLLVALITTIKNFGLSDITEPFCSCPLWATNLASYRPLTISKVVLHHVTEMSFAGHDHLHCWKRNKGFFVSVAELQHYGLFPDDESDQQLQEILENLLVEAKVPDDTCLMMESERIFLSLLKSDSEESDGRKENLKEREDFDGQKSKMKNADCDSQKERSDEGSHEGRKERLTRGDSNGQEEMARERKGGDTPKRKAAGIELAAERTYTSRLTNRSVTTEMRPTCTSLPSNGKAAYSKTRDSSKCTGEVETGRSQMVGASREVQGCSEASSVAAVARDTQSLEVKIELVESSEDESQVGRKSELTEDTLSADESYIHALSRESSGAGTRQVEVMETEEAGEGGYHGFSITNVCSLSDKKDEYGDSYGCERVEVRDADVVGDQGFQITSVCSLAGTEQQYMWSTETDETGKGGRQPSKDSFAGKNGANTHLNGLALEEGELTEMDCENSDSGHGHVTDDSLSCFDVENDDSNDKGYNPATDACSDDKAVDGDDDDDVMYLDMESEDNSETDSCANKPEESVAHQKEETEKLATHTPSTVLINLKYLSMIYEMISEMGSTWAELSKAKFRIKHWKHNCPEEQSGSQGDQEVICMDDNNISRERTKDTSAIQGADSDSDNELFTETDPSNLPDNKAQTETRAALQSVHTRQVGTEPSCSLHCGDGGEHVAAETQHSLRYNRKRQTEIETGHSLSFSQQVQVKVEGDPSSQFEHKRLRRASQNEDSTTNSSIVSGDSDEGAETAAGKRPHSNKQHAVSGGAGTGKASSDGDRHCSNSDSGDEGVEPATRGTTHKTSVARSPSTVSDLLDITDLEEISDDEQDTGFGGGDQAAERMSGSNTVKELLASYVHSVNQPTSREGQSKQVPSKPGHSMLLPPTCPDTGESGKRLRELLRPKCGPQYSVVKMSTGVGKDYAPQSFPKVLPVVTTMWPEGECSRACSCPDKKLEFLDSISILQCLQCSSCLKLCKQVLQAVICGCLVWAFNTNDNNVFFSVFDLKQVGLIKKDFSHNMYLYGSKHCRFATPEEIRFLSKRHGGLKIPGDDKHTVMYSANALCYMSVRSDFWTGSSIFPKDIYLHKVGHICPDRSSVASAAQQKSCSYLPEITQSWVKSYLWQTSGHQQPVSQVRVLDKMDHSGSSGPDSLRMLAPAVKGNSEKAPASGEGDSDGISQSHQIRTAGNPLRPQACWEPGCFLFVQICSRSSGSFASSADNFFSWLPPEQYNMQSVPQGRLDISLDTNRVIPSFSVRKRVCQPLSRTALEHAAVCEMVLLKEDLRTLQTVAHPACLKEALGSLWQTHTVVLTGVLRSKGHRFRCIQLDGKLYVNWGECLQAFSLAQADDIYQLACLLHIFLYRIPDEVTDHLRKYYGGEYRMLRSNPWVCLPSFYAMYHFCTLQVKLPHEALACGKQLHKVFIDLKPDSAMFPTCVLLKKGENHFTPPGK